MNLILRVAYSQSDPQRAEEARRLLKAVPGYSLSLIHRVAASNGDSVRARAAVSLLVVQAGQKGTTTGTVRRHS